MLWCILTNAQTEQQQKMNINVTHVQSLCSSKNIVGAKSITFSFFIYFPKWRNRWKNRRFEYLLSGMSTSKKKLKKCRERWWKILKTRPQQFYQRHLVHKKIMLKAINDIIACSQNSISDKDKTQKNTVITLY